MENQRQIYRVLGRYYGAASGEIAVRKNSQLSDAILSSAKLFMRKPIWQSWSSVIPKLVLSDENCFVAFWPTILLAGPQSDRERQFWDGGGNFLSNVDPGRIHHLCGYADLSFTVVLSDRPFNELHQFLETTKPDARELEEYKPKEPTVYDLIRNLAKARISRSPTIGLSPELVDSVEDAQFARLDQI